MGRKVGEVYFYLQMKANILENLKIMKYLVLVNTIGVMEKFIKDNGKIIK
jgi:hypothetical protein